ncbi:MAG: tetratricopeptide repeat protein [Planctomycetes bacterium]|nr:tetratricopeptide repeat protein [Planctomycetota bacterium]
MSSTPPNQQGPPAPVQGLRRRHPRLTSALGLLIVLTCLGAGAGYYLVHRHAQTRQHWHQAQQALDQYDFDRAKTELKAFLVLQPHSPEGHFLLAQACRRARVEDFEGAHQHLQEAQRLGWPEQVSALEFLMLDFQEHGSPGDTETTLRQYLSSETAELPLVLEALLRGCLRDSRVFPAQSLANQWVKRRPDDWYALLWRGSLFQFLGKPNLAVGDYQRVLKARPDLIEVRQRLGFTFLESGYNFEEALRDLEAYQQTHPDDPDTLVGIARCRRVLRQPEAARALIRQVLEQHPDHEEALQTMTQLELDREQPAAALKWLDRLEPLAHRYHRDEDLQRLLRLDPAPDSSPVPYHLRKFLHLKAAALRALGRNQEALACVNQGQQIKEDTDAIDKALEEQKKNPQDVALLDRIGLLYIRVGMGPDGENWLLRALQVKPDDPTAHRALADYYQSRNDPESRRLAEKHRRLAGENP